MRELDALEHQYGDVSFWRINAESTTKNQRETVTWDGDMAKDDDFQMKKSNNDNKSRKDNVADDCEWRPDVS